MSNPLPERFGRYRILRRLGQGGMATVYLAHDTQLDRRVALKVPDLAGPDAEEVLARFYREGRAAATIEHPNLCPVYDVGAVDGIPYLTMLYVEGKPLDRQLAEGIRLKPRQIATLMCKLAMALDKAHEKGIIHRDLKPANIMIRREGEPMVMDFGIARIQRRTEAKVTQLGTIMGTPAYMAPEQITDAEAEPGPQGDVYSLGVILYELLTGRLPFTGTPAEVFDQALNATPPRPSALQPNVDPALEGICLKAMARQPKNRYPSMNALASALTFFLRSGRQGGDEPNPVAEPALPTSSRARTPSAAGGEATAPLLAKTEAAPVFPRLSRGRRRVGRSWAVLGVAAGAAALTLIVAGVARQLAPGDRPRAALASPSSQQTPSATKTTAATTPVPSPKPEPPPLPPPPRQEPERLRPGLASAKVMELQQAWAGYLGKPIEETLDLGGGATLTLVLVPPGSYRMGSSDADVAEQLRQFPGPKPADFKAEQPSHEVEITKPFYLGKYEVTKRQFTAFVKAEGYLTDAEKTGGGQGYNAAGKYEGKRPGFSWENTGFPQTDEHPVVNVSWNDAGRFCSWLQSRWKRRVALPSEAQWEYASRACTTTLFASGNDAETLAQVGNVNDGTAKRQLGHQSTIAAEDGFAFTAPVGRFRPNALGLHDMHGNVWEWCQDWFSDEFYGKSPLQDPVNDQPGTGRIMRGGSWFDLPRYCGTGRFSFAPEYKTHNVGFRILVGLTELPVSKSEPDSIEPFQIAMNGLAGMKVLDAIAPPSAWRKPGVFAELSGQADVNFPKVDVDSFAFETELVIRNKGQIKFVFLRPDGQIEIAIEAVPSGQARLRCLLYRVHGVYTWQGERHGEIGEEHRLTLLAVKDRQLLYRDGVRIGSASAPAGPLQLRVWGKADTDATIRRCRLRPLTEDEAKELQ